MYKPGEIVSRSGIYGSGGREATLSAGDRFPPTSAGGTWTVVRLTQTKKRRRGRQAKRVRG